MRSQRSPGTAASAGIPGWRWARVWGGAEVGRSQRWSGRRSVAEVGAGLEVWEVTWVAGGLS